MPSVMLSDTFEDRDQQMKSAGKWSGWVVGLTTAAVLLWPMVATMLTGTSLLGASLTAATTTLAASPLLLAAAVAVNTGYGLFNSRTNYLIKPPGFILSTFDTLFAGALSAGLGYCVRGGFPALLEPTTAFVVLAIFTITSAASLGYAAGYRVREYLRYGF